MARKGQPGGLGSTPSDEQVERAKKIERDPELEVSEGEVEWAQEVLRQAGEL